MLSLIELIDPEVKITTYNDPLIPINNVSLGLTHGFVTLIVVLNSLEFLSYFFRYVFMILGGNDIEDGCATKYLVRSILSIVQDMKEAGIKRVFVSSIVERGSKIDFIL